MIKIFVLHPGKIRNRSLGKVTLVTADDLIDLYGLERTSCVVANPLRSYVSNYDVKYVHVYPQADGNYDRKRLNDSHTD